MKKESLFNQLHKVNAPKFNANKKNGASKHNHVSYYNGLQLLCSDYKAILLLFRLPATFIKYHPQRNIGQKLYITYTQKKKSCNHRDK